MPVMESVTLENFRCFREKQTVRLAPLTLLVGENSTGKTSFLALLRVLAELAGGPGWTAIPDFKKPPFDLGVFDDIVHDRGQAGHATSFAAGFRGVIETSDSQLNLALDHTFSKRGAATGVRKRRVCTGDVYAEDSLDPAGGYQSRIGTQRRAWNLDADGAGGGDFPSLQSLGLGIYQWVQRAGWNDAALDCETSEGNPELTVSETRSIHELASLVFGVVNHLPFASAPVRSKPRRTYDPTRSDRDPEGNYIPMLLADLARGDADEWQRLRRQIEAFGKQAGLFDELRVRFLGGSDSDPFQLQVRKGAKRAKGPFRNLIDVGYGVSQVLPLVTEMLRSDAPNQFLLQQPEVHLHPSAQAALGSLFCNVAANNDQIIVETHSDHLVDRIRMDVRDKRSALKADDVLILYFERDGFDVKIREIRWDEQGNLQNAPASYRRFFMEEMDRAIWGAQ